MNSKESSLPITLVLYLLLFVYGMSFTMIGPLMPDFLQRYGLKLAEGGTIVSIQNVSGLAAIIFCGLFGDRLNKKGFIAIGIGLFMITLLGIGTAPSFGLLMAIFFVFGIGTRIFDTLSNALISDIHGVKRSLYLNLLHTFFGLGAFLGPLFVFYLTDSGVTWNKTFLYLGFAAIVIFVLFLAVLMTHGKKSCTEKTKIPEKSIGLVELFTRPRMWILGLIIFIHMGVQGVLNTWMPLFADASTNSGAFMSSFALSAFWIGIILSRSLVSRLSERFGEIFMIRWGGLLSLIVFIPALFLGNALLLTLGSGFLGLCIGFTIPYVMSIGCGWYPEKSAAVTSMLLIFGYFSVALYPWISGLLGDYFGLIAAMILVIVSQLVLFVITWFLPGRRLI